MKRISQIVIVIALVSIFAAAQAAKSDAIDDQQWNELVTALEGENWDTAAKLSSEYLKTVKSDDGPRGLERLRFMYLYSAAGRVSSGKMSFEDLEKQLKDFVGKQVMLPALSISGSCTKARPPLFNTICGGDDPTRVMITSTNKTATTIHAFVYIQLNEKFDPAKNENKLGSVIGKIDSIAPNPNKSRFLVMRIYISDAIVLLRDRP
jgi:hypothetical protein